MDNPERRATLGTQDEDKKKTTKKNPKKKHNKISNTDPQKSEDEPSYVRIIDKLSDIN